MRLSAHGAPQTGECDPFDGPEINEAAFLDKGGGIFGCEEFSIWIQPEGFCTIGLKCFFGNGCHVSGFWVEIESKKLTEGLRDND